MPCCAVCRMKERPSFAKVFGPATSKVTTTAAYAGHQTPLQHAVLTLSKLCEVMPGLATAAVNVACTNCVALLCLALQVTLATTILPALLKAQFAALTGRY